MYDYGEGGGGGGQEPGKKWLDNINNVIRILLSN